MLQNTFCQQQQNFYSSKLAIHFMIMKRSSLASCCWTSPSQVQCCIYVVSFKTEESFIYLDLVWIKFWIFYTRYCVVDLLLQISETTKQFKRVVGLCRKSKALKLKQFACAQLSIKISSLLDWISFKHANRTLVEILMVC